MGEGKTVRDQSVWGIEATNFSLKSIYPILLLYPVSMLKRGEELCLFVYMVFVYHVDSKDIVFNYPEKALAGMVKDDLVVEMVVMEAYVYIWVSSKKETSNMSYDLFARTSYRGAATGSSRLGMQHPATESTADILD